VSFPDIIVHVIGAIYKAVSHIAIALSVAEPCINLAHIPTHITAGKVGTIFFNQGVIINPKGRTQLTIDRSHTFLA
jgi:hypothetical protein